MDRPITFGNGDHRDLTTSLLTEDHLRCSLCTEVLRDPVSIPCGHSYCRRCIETHWSKTEKAEGYPCPQCRKRSRTRPALCTNSALAKVILKVQQAGFKTPALPHRFYAGPGDVACDLCPEKKLKAVKSCLTCTVSYCETHVRQHYTVAALQRHPLVEVTGHLEDKLCQLHHRALEVFCKTDHALICLECAFQDHRGHTCTVINVETQERYCLLRIFDESSKYREEEKNKMFTKPDPAHIEDIKPNCVTLRFLPSEELLKYRVEYRTKSTGVSPASGLLWNAIVSGFEDTFTVTRLKPDTQYQIRYSVIDEFGMSDFSEVMEVKTPKLSPERPLVWRRTKHTTKVTWVQLQAVLDGGASVLQYKVEYKEAGLEGWSTIFTKERYCYITVYQNTCYRVRVSAVYEDGDTSEPSLETEIPVHVWLIDLSERKASLLLEVLKLQAKKRPVELWKCSDEESEVRSFLQCLPYISQLSFDRHWFESSKQIKFLVDLLSLAAEVEEQTGEETLKQLSSVCSYTTFPLCGWDEDVGVAKLYQSDFLLDLCSHVKDYETQSGRSVLPALLPVYQSAPAVWFIDLSERKTSLLLEVLKLQPEKKPVTLCEFSDEESEVRSFLQCLPYISQLSFDRLWCGISKDIKFLVDLLSLAAEVEEQTGEETLKQLSSVCSYTTFPLCSWDEDDDDKEYQSDVLLDLYSHVKDYETQTGRNVLPALQPVYQSAPAVWLIDLSERKTSLLLEVLKLHPEKPVKLYGWSDEESELRSFLQCLPYISHLSCEDGFFQRVCGSVPVRSREEAQQLVPLLQTLDFTLVLSGELPEETCRSVGRVLGLCASRVDLTLTPSKISIKGASLLLTHVTQLHKLRLNEAMAVNLSRLVGTGRVDAPEAIKELSLVLERTRLSEAALSRVVSSVASLLRLWSVQCLDLTDVSIHPHSLITLLGHHGPLTLRLCSKVKQHMAVVVYEAQDDELTQSFLEKLGGDLTSCSLDWEVLLYLLQQSTQNNPVQVDLRKNKLSEKNISDLLPFLDRVVIKRPSTSFVMSAVREIYESRTCDRVSSLLRLFDHVINLNTRDLNTVDCAALRFTLQHSHQVRLNLLWTSTPPGEIESFLPLLDRVSHLSVDRRLLLRFLHCCAASPDQQGAAASAAELLRALQLRLDLSCSSSVDLSAQQQGETLCLGVGDCRAISTVLRDGLHTPLHTQQPQLILQDCEVEDAALGELLPILDVVKLSTSKALLLQLIKKCSTGDSAPRYAGSLCRALGGELDLSETRLNQGDCRSLALVLKHSEGLLELDLSHCKIGWLLKLLLPHLHKAQVLDLSYNDITDALTGRILKLVSKNSSIQTVRLLKNRIQKRLPFLTDKRFEIW